MIVDIFAMIIQNNPFLLVVLIIALLVGTFYVYRNIQSERIARYIEAVGQYEAWPKSIIDDAIKESQRNGSSELFIPLLTLIRQKYGHNGLKIGHMYWIWEQIDNKVKVDQVQDIPSFVKPVEVPVEKG